MSTMNDSEKPLLRPGRAGTWVAVLLAVTVLTWLVVGVATALGGWIGWLVAAVPIVVFIALPFSLYWLSEGRTGPSWVALIFTIALLVTAVAVPGDRYMRAVGTPVTATVSDVSCSYENRSGRCLYDYTLRGPDGRTLPGAFQDTVEYPPGSSLSVVADPRGVIAPRLAADLETTWIFDIATLVAFAGFAATAVLAAVLGERRRRELAATAGERTRVRKPGGGSGAKRGSGRKKRGR
ncbi:hypothetical protein GCM10009779_50340 [Polymorphospora rubra]|uniref:Uncharacterized protein n=2 Tax=Polymorphospora rubra TaxID=338584 RepID=A0A810NA62_9ACTN|nr:hypothetical protein Prubr_54740 [Polymorphospora rubra]